MIAIDHTIDDGYILPLGDLREHLGSISHDNHQWDARLVACTSRRSGNGGRELYVSIRYTNPDLPGLPNDLRFLFPVVPNGAGMGVGQKVLVCLHPSAAVTLQEGLYFHNEELKTDLIEDWGRFWEPLRDALVHTG